MRGKLQNSVERDQGRTKFMERCSMFMNKKMQYCPDAISSQLDLQIQFNSYQNLSKVFYGY